MAVFCQQEILFAADFQPLPPVALPPLATVPTVPSTQPSTGTPAPLIVTQPEPIALSPTTAPTASTTLQAPPVPSTLPSIPAAPTTQALIPATIPSAAMTGETEPGRPTAVPELSQPLRPAPAETATETAKKVEEEGIYFNLADEDIREVVKQISRALGKNFLLDDKLKGKLTIISERKMTKDEVWEAFQSALDVLGFTVVQGPAGLLKIVAVRDALSNPIDVYTDSTPFTDRFITRLITLKNISAADMANVIKGMISKEGNLFAYPVTNTLILTDSGTNINRLIRLINELDQEGPQEILEIIPIIYANAKDLAAKITQIYETDKGGQSTPTAAPRPRRGVAAGATVETGEEVPRLRKVIPDERTNALIVLASKMAIHKVRDLIRKLDSPLSGDEGEVHVYYLKHATAKDLETVLNALSGQVSKDKEKKPSGGTAGGGAPGAAAAAPSSAAASQLIGGAEFEGKFTVTADETTNALVITAGAKDFNTLVEQVISKLDIPRRQVYVEAVIVELSITQEQQLGVGAIAGKQFGNNLALFGSTFGFLDPTKLLSGTIGGADTGTTIDINTPNPAGGNATTTQVPPFFAALQFTQNNTNANILSTPNILTLDNQEAEIKVGQKVPFPSANATTIGGSLQTTFTREDVALTLKIKPQISEGGAIRLEVTQEDREVLDQQSTFSQTAGPTTTERSIKTAIVASDGQTMVLGGLIRDAYTMTVNKVPGLGDIPILGYLFKTRKKRKDKVNLLVFLTPHIIREPRDFLKILQRKIEEQNRFIETNYTKSQQKQIRKSLEEHADELLKSGQRGYLPPEEKKQTLEDQFPMSVTPTTQPTASAPQAEEINDLALEKPKKRGKKTTPKPVTTSPANSGSETKKSPETGGDIDLSY